MISYVETKCHGSLRSSLGDQTPPAILSSASPFKSQRWCCGVCVWGKFYPQGPLNHPPQSKELHKIWVIHTPHHRKYSPDHQPDWHNFKKVYACIFFFIETTIFIYYILITHSPSPNSSQVIFNSTPLQLLSHHL